MSTPVPHSFLTALTPIEYRADDPDGNLRQVRTMLASHNQEKSPFHDCPMAHMVRLQVIDQLRLGIGNTSDVFLSSRYLLFVAELDGNVDDFLDCLYRVAPGFVADVWGRCIGYPRYQGAVFFRRYIHRCMFGDPLPFAAFPESVHEILRALERKKQFSDWAATQQGASNADLHAAWRAKLPIFENPAVPPPGTL